MKNLKLLFILLIILLFNSCNEKEVTKYTQEPILENSNISQNDLGVLDRPIKHYCPTIRDCQYPKYDCFAEIIVTPTNKIYLNELDNRINNNSVNEFFKETGNFSYVFNGFFGRALYDLRDSITTLRKFISPRGFPEYYIVFINDTNSRPDYSNDY